MKDTKKWAKPEMEKLDVNLTLEPGKANPSGNQDGVKSPGNAFGINGKMVVIGS